jgi:hypothetical protein
MTIGPAPMIMIEEMSVRFGMSLGDIRVHWPLRMSLSENRFPLFRDMR